VAKYCYDENHHPAAAMAMNSNIERPPEDLACGNANPDPMIGRRRFQA
jgi:hypothetical protein